MNILFLQSLWTFSVLNLEILMFAMYVIANHILQLVL